MFLGQYFTRHGPDRAHNQYDDSYYLHDKDASAVHYQSYQFPPLGVESGGQRPLSKGCMSLPQQLLLQSRSIPAR